MVCSLSYFGRLRCLDSWVHYNEAQRGEIEARHGTDAQRVDSPAFASYATLRRGIQYERGYVEWCAWMAETLERAQQAETHGETHGDESSG